jgi:hypothetical protein
VKRSELRRRRRVDRRVAVFHFRNWNTSPSCLIYPERDLDRAGHGTSPLTALTDLRCSRSRFPLRDRTGCARQPIGHRLLGGDVSPGTRHSCGVQVLRVWAAVARVLQERREHPLR